METSEVAIAGVALGLLMFAMTWVLSPILRALFQHSSPTIDSEDSFVNPLSKTGYSPFPSLIHQEDTADTLVYLSVIVPAYNEAERLPGMLDEALKYLKARQAASKDFTFEVIVVDDGSVDATASTVIKYTHEHSADMVRLCKLATNNGKGGAVCKGMLRARGQYLLMADADGATEFSDVERLERGMKQVERDGFGVAVGSRAHLVEEKAAERTALRSFLMHGFHFLVNILCVKGVNDTQCGFKLFSRKAARYLFRNLHIQRWAFDCELLYLARSADIPIKEEAVKWHEVDGSKLSVAVATVQMLRDLVLIRACYQFGIWRAQ